MTVEFTGSSLDAPRGDHTTVEGWLARALPVEGPLSVTESDVEAMRAVFCSRRPLKRAEVEAAVAPGSAVVPALVHLLASTALWEDNRVGGWNIAWILTALAWIGDARAVVYVLRAVVEHPEELGDFLTEDLRVVLAGFGPAAFRGLSAVVLGRPVDEYVRSAAGAALYSIAVDHPAMRPRFCEVLTELYSTLRTDGSDAYLAGALIDAAARTHDPTVDALVRTTIANERQDLAMGNLHQYEREREAAPWSRETGGHEGPMEAMLRERPSWR